MKEISPYGSEPAHLDPLERLHKTAPEKAELVEMIIRGDTITRSAKQVASHFGVTPRTIQLWRKDPLVIECLSMAADSPLGIRLKDQSIQALDVLSGIMHDDDQFTKDRITAAKVFLAETQAITQHSGNSTTITVTRVQEWFKERLAEADEAECLLMAQQLEIIAEAFRRKANPE